MGWLKEEYNFARGMLRFLLDTLKDGVKWVNDTTVVLLLQVYVNVCARAVFLKELSRNSNRVDGYEGKRNVNRQRMEKI